MADQKSENSSANDAIGNAGGDGLSSIQQPPSSNVIVEPCEIAFKIGKGVAARSNIRITNKLSTAVAFKVKTTQPHMYVVKPNQEIIPPYQHADVSVNLLDNERDKLIFDSKSASSADNKKQRFQIQTISLSDEESNHMKELNGSTEKSEEFAKLFERGKTVESLILKVLFDTANNQQSPTEDDRLVHMPENNNSGDGPGGKGTGMSFRDLLGKSFIVDFSILF